MDSFQTSYSDWKDAERANQAKQIGLSLMRWKEFPELVMSGLNGMKSLDYNGLPAVLLEDHKRAAKQISKLVNK